MTSRLYRLLLLAFPAGFRERFGGDMTAAFLQLARERRSSGGVIGVIGLWVRTLADIAANAWAVHAAAGAHRRHPHGDKRMRNLWSSIVQDVRYAGRTVRRAPGVAAVVVATMALGIGASSAIVSLVRAVMLRPLPYHDPAGLLTIWNDTPTGARVASGWLGPQLGERFSPLAPPYLPDLRQRATGFSDIVGFSPTWEMTLTGSGEAAVVEALYVSDGMLSILGLAPVAGRDLSGADHRPGAARVVLVTAAMWRRTSGKDAFDGRSIQLNGEPYTIVGILPEAARLPGTPAQIWIPFVHNPFAAARQVTVMTVLARLRPGVSMLAAREELKAVARSFERDFPESKGYGLALVPLSERVSGRAKPLLVLLVASVALLVAIAVTNVANLLLARASEREREIAVRAALGAGRARIVRQVLTESVLLALAGAVAGVVMAWWTLGSLVTLLQNDLPHGADVRVDYFVLAVTGAIAVAAGLLFGMAPAFTASKSGPADALRHGARAGTRARRLRQVLVAVEVALAFVLLTSAGLMLRSFSRLSDVNPGFRTERMIAAPVGLPSARYPEGADRAQFFGRLIDATRQLPGIENAALVNRLPLSRSTNNAVNIQLDGRPPDPQGMNVDRRIASEDYFAAMSIPVVAGRVFRESDTPDSFPVAVINTEMARRYWPASDALGARVRIELLSGPGPWLTIVGVVGSVRHHGLNAEVRPELWVPYAQAPVNGMVLIARTSVDPESLVAPVRRVVQSIDPELPVTPATLESVVSASIAGPRSRTALLSAFAAVALLLATVGIAGVVAYTVSRMTRDIGVHLALGADRLAILRLVLRLALTPAVAGLALGAAAALFATRAMTTMLFEVKPADPATFVTVAAGLLITATAASLLPAVRATRVDPASVLRVD
jgi:putative ABC transport system permease protein